MNDSTSDKSLPAIWGPSWNHSINIEVYFVDILKIVWASSYLAQPINKTQTNFL